MQQRARRQLVTFAAFALSILVWVLVLGHLRLEMAITHFLPAGSRGDIPEILHALTESELARTTIVDLGVKTSERHADLLRAAQRFTSDLRTRASIERVRSGIEPGDDEKVVGTLRSVPPSAFLPPERFAADAYEPRLIALKDELGGPLGPLARAFAPSDPMGATLGVLDRLRRLEGNALGSEEGILFSEDGLHAFVFVIGRGSAFDADTQRGFLRDLQDALDKSGVAEVSLEVSSVAKYTVVSERMIRGDIERIGTLSTIGILLLFGLFFRSLRMLLLALVPLLFGTIVATVVCYFLFGSIHGVTLAFGSSLLGVGIDYAEHYFSHFSLTPERGADRVMHEVRPGLGLGALTTMIGLAGIAWADFPGAKELAVFACLAVFGSLIGTVLFLPPWMPTRYARPPLPARLERSALHWLAVLRRRKGFVWASGLVCVALAAGVLRARFIDDVSVLMATDRAVADEDARVRGRITRAEPGRFAVVIGRDEAEALEKLDKTNAALAAAHDAGLVDHYVPLGELLRSDTAQRESFAAAKQNLPAFERALRAQGFEVEPFRPYVDSLAGAPKILTPEMLLASPLGDLIRPLCPKLGTRQAFVIPLGGVPSTERLRARLPDATVIDERALLESTYSHVRERVLQLVAFGLVVVLAILRIRYGGWRVSLAAFVPAALAALLTIGTFGWFGISLNVLHAVGLVLVLSMGVDFGIFVAEGRSSDEDTARALVGIFTATLTTLLSFGLLAWSQSPALRALGSTMSLGLVWSLLLCPSVFILAERVRDTPQKGPS